jgi:hypothetical protein
MLYTMRYITKRSYVWDAAIAYSVGLLASDGCLQKDGRHIDLTSVDLEQLANFSRALGREFFIGRKHNNSLRQAYRIQFSDAAFYDFLMEVGLTPAKSKTIAHLNIPDHLYPDFLRGLFDGDGSTYGYMDPRWKSSFMFYVCLTSASINFIYYLQLANSRLIGVTSGSIRHSKRAYTLAYAKADSHKLYQYMYYSDQVLCLTRKKVKLQTFIQQDQAVIIT